MPIVGELVAASMPEHVGMCLDAKIGVNGGPLDHAREAGRPRQSQPETERYVLQIDRQSKRSFKTPEAARKAALEIKSRFPALQISVYDALIGSHTIVDLPSPAT
jgi:hypothetical protein